MASITAALPPDLARFVESELAAGSYASASELIRDGLRLLQRERAAAAETLAILRREIQIGLDEAATGDLSPHSIDDIAAQVAREA